jgi:hypothetical protein
MEINMKRISLTLAALAAFSGIAIAQNFDGDDQAPYRFDDGPSESSAQTTNTLESIDSAPSGEWFNGKYGLTQDPDDIRRWDEKGD